MKAFQLLSAGLGNQQRHNHRGLCQTVGRDRCPRLAALQLEALCADLALDLARFPSFLPFLRPMLPYCVANTAVRTICAWGRISTRSASRHSKYRLK